MTSRSPWRRGRGCGARGGSAAVLDEQREARERLGAALARVLLQLGVRLQVRAKVGPVGERAPALRTRERPFSRMGPHVALQHPTRAGIPLPASVLRRRRLADESRRLTSRFSSCGPAAATAAKTPCRTRRSGTAACASGCASSVRRATRTACRSDDTSTSGLQRRRHRRRRRRLLRRHRPPAARNQSVSSPVFCHDRHALRTPGAGQRQNSTSGFFFPMTSL